MKKNFKISITTILILGCLVTIGIAALAKANSTEKESKTNYEVNSTETKTAVTQAKTNSTGSESKTNHEPPYLKYIIPPVQSNEGKKISEINTTWGEFIDSYNKEAKNSISQDITKDRKVRVVKSEYVDGIETKAGFFSYGLVTRIYDEKTGELLTSMGDYTNKK